MDNRSLNGNLEKYKLIYFDLRGRGEIPRLLFHAAEVDFEDKRIDNEEEWINTLKNQMPQKVLPVLEVDGKQLSQSLTICRYLAREFGLTGKTNWEQAQVEQISDTMDDLRAEVAKWIYEKTEDKKNDILSKLRSDVFPKFIDILEKLLRANSINSGYFVGDGLTLADLSVFETWTMPLQLHPDAFDGHPEIQAHRARVEKHENLADYIRNRPVRPV